jgi:hypothetical protein
MEEGNSVLAKLKCPHGNGEDTYGAEGVKEVASNGAGEGRKGHLKGGKGEDRCILPVVRENGDVHKIIN